MSVCVQLGTLSPPFPSCHWLACRGHPEWVGQDGEGPSRDAPFLSLVLSWYHGAISGTDAENVLRTCKEASYLVCDSETSKNDFSLSLK